MATDTPYTPRITLYADNNFGGDSRVFTGEANNLISHGFNDKCSSIKVQSGVWLLYENPDYTGNMWVVWEGQVYDNAGKWTDQDNALSSLKPVKVKTSEFPKCELYDNSKLSRMITLTDTANSLGDYNFNDICSYVHVISGTWVGYYHGNCRGPQILLQEGDHDLTKEHGGIFNNGLSSIKPIDFNLPIKILSIDYDTKAAISMKTPKTLFEGCQENNTDTEQHVDYEQTKTVSVTNSSQFRWSTSFTSSISMTTSIEFPLIKVDNEISLSSTTQEEQVDGTVNTNEQSWTIKIPMAIPPHKRICAKSTITEGKVSIPFTAKLQKGSRYWTEKGTWLGVQHFNFSTTYSEHPI